jgi:hypothetical protein
MLPSKDIVQNKDAEKEMERITKTCYKTTNRQMKTKKNIYVTTHTKTSKPVTP